MEMAHERHPQPAALRQAQGRPLDMQAKGPGFRDTGAGLPKPAAPAWNVLRQAWQAALRSDRLVAAGFDFAALCSASWAQAV